ncbi:stalk domain-containing protein [Paenibacillus thalictri]|uniref:Copper amine oxidase-like N-terminal domain-containing protein n=1 Tax=Paenibacillus thalictri TaxID=2527873 RepID=A0A4Q9DWX3_9BACL|nr:stalk domain-containing protein [Paenibacillus thalictri]TBL80332.1 hypothetical protein EYB31_07905 [Paenibacillus thalictri]
MKKTMITCLTAAMIGLAAIPAGFTAVPQKTYASGLCTKEATTPEYDYMVASNVFYGTVTKVDDVYFDGKPYRMATFVSDKSFKGDFVHTVLTAPDSTQCGVTFEMGHNYLVYANNRLGHPAVSEFDVLQGDEIKERIAWLENMNMVPTPPAGEQYITLYPGTDVSVALNGSILPVSPAPVYFENSLYVPTTLFRDVLGYVTVWNSETGRYDILLKSDWAGIAAKGDPAQSQFNGSSIGVPASSEPFTAPVTYSDVTVKVDGRIYAPENQPFKYDGVVYVPLRDTAEKLGLKVNWIKDMKLAQMKDIRPIDPLERPVLTMKLSSNTGGHDLIVDRVNDGQVVYHEDRILNYGSTPPAQQTASFSELIKETDGGQNYRVRLFLQHDERENELIITDKLMKSLLTDPAVRTKMNFVLGHDFFNWPTYGVFSTANVD